MIKLSPSSLDRYALCPGAYWAEKGLPSQPETEWLAEGRFMHSLLAADGGRRKELLAQATRAQRHDYDICIREGKELHHRVFPVDGADGYTVDKWYTEIRTQAKVMPNVVISGQIDYLAIRGTTALVIDWKFGRGEVEEAQNNLQLRAYAILASSVAAAAEPMTVYLAIVQPRAPQEDRVTVTCYMPDDIERAALEIIDIATAIEFAEHGAARGPGEKQCRYCKALSTDRCPESREMMTALAPLDYQGVMPSGQELSELLGKARAAKAVIEWVESYTRERLLAGDDIPGWRLKANAPIRTLPDVAAVWERLQGHLTAEEFIALTSISITQLQDALAARKGWGRAEAKESLGVILGDAIVWREKQASLERAK